MKWGGFVKFKKINILSIISILFFAAIIYFIVSLNILPTVYICIILFVLLLIQILGILFINLRKKILYIIGIVVLVFSIIINGIGSYYLYHTNNFLNKSFNSSLVKHTTTFYVIANSKSNYKDKIDISGNISYYKNTNNIDKAITKLENNYNISLNSNDDVSAMFNELKDNKINFILVEKSSYNIVFEIDNKLNKNDYKIIYEFDISEKEKTVNSDSKSDVFNVYIGGTDFTNSLIDFNMIATINTKTHEVLFTSIPRDYYIPVYGKDGRRDTLSFMGSYGMDNNIKSLEQFFGISIDYYVKIKTESLVGIVDAVGGINYCSDIAFTTTHATVLNTYDDSTGKRLYVKSGCQQLNGIEALTVARERLAFNGGDRIRQQNCVNIMIDIFDKLKSTNTLTNYNNILSSLSNLYETTIPRNLITNIIKDMLNNGTYSFTSQSVNGFDSNNYVYLTTLTSYVMEPDMNTVNAAKEKIQTVLNS